ncbi:hypothetical protein HA052_11105 [Chromobacterium haemolyticum]|uniref:Uncharacterized protein n=1 Tax=Chromobacterium fluminis TaxID=3044269 RepID=A0ABX0L9T1_9NEIS|nr:hypothetical protein [Chromobacterium haemolyticum]NHR05748.1 hypothetical protein [Chromobacterium haemolyticum]
MSNDIIDPTEEINAVFAGIHGRIDALQLVQVAMLKLLTKETAADIYPLIDQAIKALENDVSDGEAKIRTLSALKPLREIGEIIKDAQQGKSSRLDSCSVSLS